jgi:hypothetical protein
LEILAVRKFEREAHAVAAKIIESVYVSDKIWDFVDLDFGDDADISIIEKRIKEIIDLHVNKSKGSANL